MIAFPFEIKTARKISFSGIFTQDSKKVVKILFDNDFKPMEFSVGSTIKDPLTYIASKIQNTYPDKYNWVVDKNSDKKVKIKHSEDLVSDNSEENNFVTYYMIGKNIFITSETLDLPVSVSGVEMGFTLRSISTIMQTINVPKDGKYTKHDTVNRILFDNFVDYSERGVVNFVHSNHVKIKQDLTKNDVIFVAFTKNGNNKSYKVVDSEYKPRSWEYVLKFNKDMYI